MSMILKRKTLVTENLPESNETGLLLNLPSYLLELLDGDLRKKIFNVGSKNILGDKSKKQLKEEIIVLSDDDTFSRNVNDSKVSIPLNHHAYFNENVNTAPNHLNDICDTLKYNRKVQKDLLLQKKNSNKNNKKETSKDSNQQCENEKKIGKINEKNNAGDQNKDNSKERNVEKDVSYYNKPPIPSLKTVPTTQNCSNEEKYDNDFESEKSSFKDEQKFNPQMDKKPPSPTSSIKSFKSIASSTKSLSSPNHKSPLSSPSKSSLTSPRKSSLTSPTKSSLTSPTKSLSPAKSPSLPPPPLFLPPPPSSLPPPSQLIEKAGDQQKFYNNNAKISNDHKLKHRKKQMDAGARNAEAKVLLDDNEVKRRKKLVEEQKKKHRILFNPGRERREVVRPKPPPKPLYLPQHSKEELHSFMKRRKKMMATNGHFQGIAKQAEAARRLANLRSLQQQVHHLSKKSSKSNVVAAFDDDESGDEDKYADGDGVNEKNEVDFGRELSQMINKFTYPQQTSISFKSPATKKNQQTSKVFGENHLTNEQQKNKKVHFSEEISSTQPQAIDTDLSPEQVLGMFISHFNLDRNHVISNFRHYLPLLKKFQLEPDFKAEYELPKAPTLQNNPEVVNEEKIDRLTKISSELCHKFKTAEQYLAEIIKKMDERCQNETLPLQHASTNTTQPIHVQQDSVQIDGADGEEYDQYSLYNVLKRKIREKKMFEQYKQTQEHFKTQLSGEPPNHTNLFNNDKMDNGDSNGFYYTSLKFHVNQTSLANCYGSNGGDNNEDPLNYNSEQEQTKEHPSYNNEKIVKDSNSDGEKDDDDGEDKDEKNRNSFRDFETSLEETKVMGKLSAKGLEHRMRAELVLLDTFDVVLQQLNNMQVSRFILQNEQENTTLVHMIKKQQEIFNKQEIANNIQEQKRKFFQELQRQPQQPTKSQQPKSPTTTQQSTQPTKTQQATTSHEEPALHKEPQMKQDDLYPVTQMQREISFNLLQTSSSLMEQLKQQKFLQQQYIQTQQQYQHQHLLQNNQQQHSQVFPQQLTSSPTMAKKKSLPAAKSNLSNSYTKSSASYSSSSTSKKLFDESKMKTKMKKMKSDRYVKEVISSHSTPRKVFSPDNTSSSSSSSSLSPSFSSPHSSRSRSSQYALQL